MKKLKYPMAGTQISMVLKKNQWLILMAMGRLAYDFILYIHADMQPGSNLKKRKKYLDLPPPPGFFIIFNKC